MSADVLLTGEALHARAKELGVICLSDIPVIVPGSGAVPCSLSDYELQRRVMEAERHLREHRLWIVAVISAVASVVSAIGAWLAVVAK